MLENTIHSIVGLARAEKALNTVTGTSLGPFLHTDPQSVCPSLKYITPEITKPSQSGHILCVHAPRIHTIMGAVDSVHI